MKGVDYTKQLAKEREFFQDAFRKNKDATEKRITDNEARHENIQSKTRQNFVEDKADLEKNYQKNVGDVQQRTTDALQAKNEKYNYLANKERESFERDSQEKSKEFDQRLNDIKSSYQKSFKSEKDLNAEMQNNNKSRYIKNIQDQTQKVSDQLNSYQDKFQSEGSDLKSQYNREREQLVRTQEDRIRDVRKDEGNKQAELKDRVGTDIKRTKEVHAADHEHMKQYTEDKLDNMQQLHEGRSQKVARDYSVKNQNLTEAQLVNAKRVNREQQDKVLEVQRGFDKQLRSIELEKRRRDNGSGEFAAVNNKQQGIKEKEVLENRINSLKTHLGNTSKTYQEKAEADQKAFDENLKIENAEGTARKDRAVNNANADKIVTIAKERERTNKAVGNLAQLNKIEKAENEQQFNLEKINANEKIVNLKANFNDAMKKMEERIKLSVEDVTNVSNKDKAEFVKLQNEKRNKELYDIKREFSIEMDQTVQGYEHKLATFKRENEYIKMVMDQKVHNIIDQTDKKLESERAIMNEIRTTEKRDTQLASDQKENKLRTDINNLVVNYSRKLDKMQMENDTKFKIMTNDYENRLKELNASKNKDIVQIQTFQQLEVQRLKAAYEDEKARTIGGYENKIAGIQASHEERMLQLDEFKKLS